MMMMTLSLTVHRLLNNAPGIESVSNKRFTFKRSTAYEHNYNNLLMLKLRPPNDRIDELYKNSLQIRISHVRPK